ncbi:MULTISPECIES: efflux RND transporter periplasmic adaptor subunit [unclassified Colwellia]|uniref:efflux RND transporter periplasmic adaptor subunit n=1 Tax=unclassified Colwellia TaxID=196834 RepID=UPI0015F4973D|nr:MULTISPECIES: efflux RND transporter periplasmic adaptor subunit [unclassified Colwellia]MBA6233925.1 efflux RND transporter periplasmic adaptor subunit [Colwellia sp. MB02u-7]MBA6237601.1 efflux RND transporter periplasmic adaptor subunit [Colwellia sp. MB02u-11]MBA6256064.1 efflux RND transporter periplasmic adaptor subunit [Colwellia sp. MB3u-28]MBA6260797.1 efflux RND transporter periplasmic adaptor subunit [Colwellia sp. MB3u-41]MBA6300598.1 efflux RND transporter periplasmic adaptor s
MRLFLLAFSVITVLSGCDKEEQPFKEAIRPIAWQEVQQSSFDQVRRLSGTIYPVEEANLSFEVGGKIQWIKVKLGDEVKRGDALARLDQRNFNLSRQSAQANLQKSYAALSEAENEYKRYAELSSKGLVSKSGFDNAKAAFESATSAVNISKTQLDIAKKDLSDSILTAPYNGKITKRLSEPSMQISPGQAIFQIEGDDGLEVQVMVPETMIRDLSKGNEIDIHYPAFPTLNSKGTIAEISSRAATANAFPVTILINTELKNLRAGMTAEVDFTFQGIGRTGYQGKAFHLPISALAADEGQKSYVFVYNVEQQKLHKRMVQTESILNNEVLVSAGLASGEIIAIAGVSFLRDGQSVQLLDKHVKRFN